MNRKPKEAGLTIILLITLFSTFQSKTNGPSFRVIAFYTALNDDGHISYVHEANIWFPKLAAENNFIYESTNDWSNLNTDFLQSYQVVLFLDTRTENDYQRRALQTYMENGGGWMGFHFSAFALTPSTYNQDWDWYHNDFLGSGQYVSNTWRPVPAILRVESPEHPATAGLSGELFRSPANEWYRWEGELAKNPDIDILLAIDDSSYPLGTGPNEWEIWHSGYYPVVWSNRNFKMIYANLGHNDMDYDYDGSRQLSFTLGSSPQFDQLMLDSLIWLGTGEKLGGSITKDQ